MNRVEFMRQLESLLQSIAPMERDEALQYYNDYFDDAGAENEQEVIEALGNPARVAENIRRDLLAGSESAARKAKPSDRALVEYGRKPQDEGGNGAEDASRGTAESGGTSFGAAGTPNGVYGQEASAYYPTDRDGQGQGGRAGKFGKFRKADMPGWAVALLVVLLIFASPVWLGLIMGAAGVALGLAASLFMAVAAWFIMILAFGMVFVGMAVMLVVLIVTGVMCCFTDVWVGITLIGSGLVCGAIGLLFLMLTVAMAGIVTPAIFRGLGRLFRFLFGRKPAKGVN